MIGAGCTLREAAARLQLSPKTVRNLLSRFRADFPDRRYRAGPHGQRLRILSAGDLTRLAARLAEYRTAVRTVASSEK